MIITLKRLVLEETEFTLSKDIQNKLNESQEEYFTAIATGEDGDDKAFERFLAITIELEELIMADPKLSKWEDGNLNAFDIISDRYIFSL